MKKQSEAQLSAANLPAVTDLTEEQANQVAGGTMVLPKVVLGGCPYCTSGRLTGFANLAAVVNPAFNQF
jgi:hypothetical protein